MTGGKFTQAVTISQIKALVSQPGQRGIIFGYRGPNTIGHYFNVRNKNGLIKFQDGQSNTPADLKDSYMYFSF